jgi:hypothetical protein
MLDAGVSGEQPGQQVSGGDLVLVVGGGDHHDQQQPRGVDRDVSFAASDAFAGVVASVAARLTVSAAPRLESITLALGRGAGPAWVRNRDVVSRSLTEAQAMPTLGIEDKL